MKESPYHLPTLPPSNHLDLNAVLWVTLNSSSLFPKLTHIWTSLPLNWEINMHPAFLLFSSKSSNLCFHLMKNTNFNIILLYCLFCMSKAHVDFLFIVLSLTIMLVFLWYKSNLLYMRGQPPWILLAWEPCVPPNLWYYSIWQPTMPFCEANLLNLVAHLTSLYGRGWGPCGSLVGLVLWA